MRNIKPWQPGTFLLSIKDVSDCFEVLSLMKKKWTKEIIDSGNIRQRVVVESDKIIRRIMK